MDDSTELKQYTETQLAKYNLSNRKIAALSKDCMKVKVKDVNDKEGYEIAKTARIGVKNIRCQIENTRKKLKKESVKYNNDVDGEAKRITALLAPIENYLISQEKIVDDEKKRIQQEKVDAIKKGEEEKQEKIKEDQRVESDRLEKIRIQQEEKEKQLKQQQDKIDADKKKIEEEEKTTIGIEQAKKESIEPEKKETEKTAASPMLKVYARDHLQFIYDRMVSVHGENEGVGYMIRFKEIIEQTT